MWSELPNFVCEKTEAQILLFAQSSMETKTQNVDLQPHCSCRLNHNARLKHRHKEFKNLLWHSLLIYEETSVHN